jgi:hypothetical protein
MSTSRFLRFSHVSTAASHPPGHDPDEENPAQPRHARRELCREHARDARRSAHPASTASVRHSSSAASARPGSPATPFRARATSTPRWCTDRGRPRSRSPSVRSEKPAGAFATRALPARASTVADRRRQFLLQPGQAPCPSSRHRHGASPDRCARAFTPGWARKNATSSSTQSVDRFCVASCDNDLPPVAPPGKFICPPFVRPHASLLPHSPDDRPSRRNRLRAPAPRATLPISPRRSSPPAVGSQKASNSTTGRSRKPWPAPSPRLADDEPLLFEAGTGVGKSLAYLVPGLIHAVDQSRQLIVSTHTISLQEQLESERPAEMPAPVSDPRPNSPATPTSAPPCSSARATTSAPPGWATPSPTAVRSSPTPIR